MSICTALLILGLFIGGALVLLEWKMPGFLMTSLKNGIANGQAYGRKRQEMKDKGLKYEETYHDFIDGIQRSVTFKPPRIEPLRIDPPKKLKRVKRYRKMSK